MAIVLKGIQLLEKPRGNLKKVAPQESISAQKPAIPTK
jgi:hypothetical protein